MTKSLAVSRVPLALRRFLKPETRNPQSKNPQSQLRASGQRGAGVLEAISKIGFWFNIAAGPSLKPTAQQSLR
jgi:hypothetical protein